METITGTIAFLNSRPTAFGTMYELKINGTGYSTGKDNPAQKFGVAAGDNVSFSAEQNAKGYWNIKGPVTKVTTAPVAAAPSALAPAARTNGKSDDVQKSITRQASRNAAIAFLNVAQTAGALPSAKTKGAGFDLLRDILDRLTDEFYNDSLNPTPYDAAPQTTGAATAAATDNDWTE